jgi:hypothetical protein
LRSAPGVAASLCDYRYGCFAFSVSLVREYLGLSIHDEARRFADLVILIGPHGCL